MSILFSIREGLSGFRRARMASAASTSAMAVALMLIGLFFALSIQANALSSWLRQRAGEMELFLDPVDARTAEALVARAAAASGVAEARYISSREAQEIFKQEFGEGAEMYYDEPFLPASIRVRLVDAWATPESLAVLAEEFGSWNRVDEVVYNQDLLVKVQRNLRLLTLLGAGIGLFVTLAAVFLVANTIRLTIYARRLLIRTMKLVGATDAYIRRPFLVEGALQGAAAGLAAGLVLWALSGAVAGAALPVGAGLSVGAALAYLLFLMALGGGLGWLASWLAVRRFIRNVALH